VREGETRIVAEFIDMCHIAPVSMPQGLRLPRHREDSSSREQPILAAMAYVPSVRALPEVELIIHTSSCTPDFTPFYRGGGIMAAVEVE